MTGEPLLIVRDLVAGYVPGVDILRGTSIDVARSELVGIIGPNGAGKSTLIKAVFGLVPVRSGTMTLDGDDIVGVHGYDLVSRGVGYVPQVRNVFGTLSVEENLRMGVYLRPDRFAARRDDVLDLFPTLDAAGKNAVRTRLLEFFEIAGADDPRVIVARRRLTGLLY